MIAPCQFLNSSISTDEINKAAAKTGYDRFIPYTFVRHLAYAFSFYSIGEPVEKCIVEDNEYTKEFAKLLKYIEFANVKTHHPLHFAFNLLKLLHKKLNLRALEKSANDHTSISLPITEDTFQNYRFDINYLTDTQLELLGVDKSLTESIELPAEVIQILNFYNGLLQIRPIEEIKYQVDKKRISSYSDFHRIRRYKFGVPSFKADLGMKKLDITKVVEVKEKSSEAILAIDLSYSMKLKDNSVEFLKAVLLYYLGEMERMPGLKLDLVIVIGRVFDVLHMTDKNELKDFILKFPGFIYPTFRYRQVFQDLNFLYPGKDVTFVTDGADGDNIKIDLKFKLHSILLIPNDDITMLSIISGGKSVVLNEHCS